jgi:hypothetical protein
MVENSWVGAQVVVSEEKVSHMEVVGYSVCLPVCCTDEMVTGI